ncbi:hypothetical protein SLOPH_2387 [Spraguea lophii 42_110]|uniref:Uncharacterized protein n=1 Tax=Spraguea lophii (strain 42_110) TaxID=1358809 RepID=S7WAC6_SPRLO|nr:hypothetical protein SLOPH_2387 [Spraguea lophii 42_110]
MLEKLGDKTNALNMRSMRKEGKEAVKTLTDKEKVVRYLGEISNITKDYSLKYDLNKCIELIEGKENQEYIELKGALEEALEESETIRKDNYDLIAENEYLKERLNENNQN